MRVAMGGFGVLCTLAGFALAQSDAFEDKLCTDLRTEVDQYLAPYEKEDKDFYLFYRKSPFVEAIDAVMAGLDEEALMRIRVLLTNILAHGCLYPNDGIEQIHKEHGLPESPTFGQVLDTILTLWGLDRSAPRWGLIDIPELDWSEMTVEEFLLTPFPAADKAGWEKDDPSHFTLRKLWSNYDLNTPEDLRKARKVGSRFFQDMGVKPEDYDMTLKEHFEKLAMEEGLKRRDAD